MNTIYKLVILALIFQIFSCKKESSKNIYPDNEYITISGVDSNYAKISAVDRIVVNPEATSNVQSDFEYLWGIYPMNTQLNNAVMDTISRIKNLDYLVKETAGNYALVLRVTNKITKYSQYFTSVVAVGTQFTRGWYVIKDENDKTDLDLFLTPENITPNQKVENVYSTINGKKLDGKAMQLRFNSFYKSETNGRFDNTRSLFLITDKDASVVAVSDLHEIRDFNSMVFGGAPIKKPGFVGNDFLVFFMQNNGQLHSMIGQGPSLGQFGGRKLKSATDEAYNLSRFHLMNISSFFFDEISSSFVTATDRSLYLTKVTDNPGTQLTANNNNKNLLYMGLKTRGPYTGVGILQDKTNPALKTLAFIYPSQYSFRITTTNLQPTDKIYNGANFALIYQDENMIYFSVGNEVWSRNLSNNFEQLQFTVPANEAITFICHRKFNGTGVELPYSYNYVSIGTSSGDNYKVRLFTKSSGNLNAQPFITLDGKGAAKDIQYISPALSSSPASFPDTY